MCVCTFTISKKSTMPHFIIENATCHMISTQTHATKEKRTRQQASAKIGSIVRVSHNWNVLFTGSLLRLGSHCILRLMTVLLYTNWEVWSWLEFVCNFVSLICSKFVSKKMAVNKQDASVDIIYCLVDYVVLNFAVFHRFSVESPERLYLLWKLHVYLFV